MLPIGEHTVGMEVSEVGDKITKVRLKGRLDTPGVDQIETRLVATLVPAGRSAIIDLSGIEFVASMAIRMLISVARGMRQRRAKLVLYGMTSLVQETFESVSLSTIIPIGADETEALQLVSS
jgi:anti-sigma B factor antagonist